MNAELTDMTRRFWISAALTLPSFCAGDGAHDPGVASRRLGDGRCVALDSIRPLDSRGAVGGHGRSSNVAGVHSLPGS